MAAAPQFVARRVSRSPERPQRPQQRRRLSSQGLAVTRYNCNTGPWVCQPDGGTGLGQYATAAECEQRCRPQLAHLPRELWTSFLPAHELYRLQSVSSEVQEQLESSLVDRLRPTNTQLPEPEKLPVYILFANVIVNEDRKEEDQHDFGTIKGVYTLPYIADAIVQAVENVEEIYDYDTPGSKAYAGNGARELFLFSFLPLNFVTYTDRFSLPPKTCSKVPAKLNLHDWEVAVSVLPIRSAVNGEVTAYYFRDLTNMLHLNPLSGIGTAAQAQHMDVRDLVSAISGVAQNWNYHTPYRTWVEGHCW